jgi:hypothetical protein
MPNRPPQKAVRAGQLDRTLEMFNAEIGQKVAESLHQYHVEFVEPRLAALEAPFYRRWWSKLKAVIRWLSPVRVEVAVTEVEPEQESEPEPPEPPSEIVQARPRIIRPDEL